MNAAETLYRTAVEFLATKHGVTNETIYQALKDKNPKIMSQWASLIASGIMANA